MADVIFKNIADVKWTSDFDSFIIQSVVDGGTGANASLTLGSSETLSASINVVSTTGPLLALGVVEVLASAEMATSSTPAAVLTLGIGEPLSATSTSVSTVSTFITMGESEGLSSTISLNTTVDIEISLGIVEVVSSTITNTSVTAGPLLTLGNNELMTSPASVQSNVNGLLDLGTFEVLGSTTINASTSDAWLQLGILEPLSASAHANIDEVVEGELTLGAPAPLSTGVVITSTSVSLLDLGVTEILGSTNPIQSIVPDIVLDLGVPEPLAHTIGDDDIPGGYTDDLCEDGIAFGDSWSGRTPDRAFDNLNTSSGTDAWYAYASEGLVTSPKAVGYDFGEGNERVITQVKLVATDRTNRVPTVFGIVGSNNMSTWDTLQFVNGETWSSAFETKTYQFSNTTAYRYVRIYVMGSAHGTEVELGEIEMMETEAMIPEPYAVSSIDSTLVLGISEPLSSTVTLDVPVTSSITMGIVEATASTGIIVSTVLDSVLTLGAPAPLSSTIFLETAGSADLILGITEVLESSSLFNSVTSEVNMILGEQELLSGTRAIHSVADATLVLGIDESLAHTINNPEFINDSNTSMLLNLNNSVEDESDYNHDITLYGGAAFDSNSKLFGSHAVKLNGGYTIVSNTDNASELDFEAGDYAIELGFLDPGVRTVGQGNYLIKEISGSDSHTFKYTQYNATILTFEYKIVDSGVTEAEITFNINQDEIDEWTYVTIFRISGSIYIRFDGKDDAFTYSINDNTYASWPDLEVAPYIIGEDIGNIASPELSIDAIRISKDTARYETGAFDPFEYVAKDVVGTATASLYLGLSEVLTSTENVISNTVDADLGFGVDEPLSNSFSITSSVTNATGITLGITEPLTGTANATIEGGTITGVLSLGIQELLASTIANTSAAAGGEIQVGNAEILSCTTGAQVVSNVNCFTIVFGATEQLSHTMIPSGYEGFEWTEIFTDPDEPYIISVSEGLLLIGTSEILSSTITPTTTISEPSIEFGGSEPMTTGVVIQSNVDSSITMGIAEDLTSTQAVISTTSTSLLDLGVTEILADVDNALTLSVDATLTLGVPESLSFTLYEFSSGPLDPYAVSLSTANLVLGVDEIIAASHVGQSVVGPAEMLLGGPVALEATTNITTTDNGDLLIGHTEDLTDECVSWVSVSGLLTTGIVETVSSTIASHSVADADLTLGISEPLSSSISVENSLDQDLTIGVGEDVAATQGVVSTTSNSLLSLGISEVVSSTVASNSVTDADLILGITEELSATTNVVLSISAFISFGVDELMSATANLESLGVAPLFLGENEFIAASRTTGTSTLADLTLGIGEPLSATSIVENTATTNLSFGIIETASVSTTFTSSSLAILTLGIVEPLSATINPSTEHDASIILGGPEALSASYLVQSNVEASTIIFGVSELASATVTNTSTTDATLVLGIDEPLSATNDVQTSIDAFITMGIVESLSATTGTIGNTIAEATLGAATILEGTSGVVIQSLVIPVLGLGVMEMMSSTIGPISTTSTSLLDLGTSEILGSVQVGQSNVAANLTLGIIEPVAFTATSITGSPTYTSELTSLIGGTAWASHYVFDHGPEKAFDGISSIVSDWKADYPADPFSPYILRWDFGDNNDQVVNVYRFENGDASLRPRDWTFEGSDDGGTTWDVLDTVVDGNTSITYNIDNMNDYRYYRWVFTRGENPTGLSIGEVNVYGYNEALVHDIEVAQSNVAISTLDLGIGEPLSSTINVTTESDSSITLGLIEVLATLGFGIAVTTSEITLGVDEPLSASIIAVENTTLGDLDIPGADETCTAGVVITTEGDASTLDTGVLETASAFKMIWSQIHTPELTLGIWEQVAATDGATAISLVEGEPLVMGIVEILASTVATHSVADASLSLGIGEYLSSTAIATMDNVAFLSTGEDELLASTIITPSVTGGELIFGLVEVMSATNITTSTTIAQAYQGIEEILESTTEKGNGASCEMSMTIILGRTPCALQFRHEYTNRGSLFKK